MKKIYIKPETEEVKLRIANQLLAGSGFEDPSVEGRDEEEINL